MNCCFERARDGDLSARSRLVDSLRPRMVKMALYYARCCGEDPDDLLQEAWAGMLEALPAMDTSIGSPEQYLICHARWRLLDAIKRARVRRCEPLETLDLERIACPDSERPAAEACVAEFSRQLKDSQRAVLDCLLAGLTWREAGDALGCTSANIAYYVRQIRRTYEQWTGEARP